MKVHVERCSLNYDTTQYISTLPMLILPSNVNKAEEFIAKFCPLMHEDKVRELCFKVIGTFGCFVWQACSNRTSYDHGTYEASGKFGLKICMA